MLTKQKYLTPSELERLNSILANAHTRDTLMIELALRLGLRASELLGLTPDDYDEQSKTLLIKTKKGGSPRELPVPLHLTKRLEAQIKPGQRIFPIGYHRLIQIWHYHRPIKKKFHALRHTFAMGLYDKTKDIRLTKSMLGHKSMSSTGIYLEREFSLDEMRRAIA